MMRTFWMLIVPLLACLPACAADVPTRNSTLAPGAVEQVFNFDGAAVPGVWKAVGDVSIDRTKNHGDGPGGSLKVAPGATVTLNVSDTDRVGKIDFWIYDDGTVPKDPTAYRDGPSWGIKNVDGTVEAVGILYAKYLSGGNSYAIGVSPDGKFLYRDVVYLGINRNKGWHKWTFTFDNTKGWNLFYDDKNVNANSPRIIQDNVKARGFTSIVLAGDTGADNPQTLWVDDISVSEAGPLTSTGVPESRIMEAVPLPAGGYYAGWKNGPPTDPHYFPIGVWLQSPSRAAEYKAIGINQYIALWDGPTEEQLADLKKTGMRVICDQNAVALKHLDDPTIIGWMQVDEPDNAQSDGKGGYGPPITPETIITRYNKMKAADPTRPVYLGLGQSVAWDNYIGRGVRTNKPEDYPQYAKGGDILSYDIYPVVHDNGEIKGKLWKVPFGVDRLVQWTEGKKPVWNDIECTRISNPNAKPTPAQVRTEVWMSIIHGSRGIVYFVHQFKEAGAFIEAGLLADKEMTEAVRKLNHQILDLAPVLNSPTVSRGAAIVSSNKMAPVDVMIKKYGGDTYVFAVGMRNAATHATFSLADLPANASAEVLGENRKIDAANGRFSDDFKGYDVHIYRIGRA